MEDVGPGVGGDAVAGVIGAVGGPSVARYESSVGSDVGGAVGSRIVGRDADTEVGRAGIVGATATRSGAPHPTSTASARHRAIPPFQAVGMSNLLPN
jgi:hypothetical protein